MGTEETSGLSVSPMVQVSFSDGWEEGIPWPGRPVPGQQATVHSIRLTAT